MSPRVRAVAKAALRLSEAAQASRLTVMARRQLIEGGGYTSDPVEECVAQALVEQADAAERIADEGTATSAGDGADALTELSTEGFLAWMAKASDAGWRLYRLTEALRREAPHVASDLAAFMIHENDLASSLPPSSRGGR